MADVERPFERRLGRDFGTGHTDVDAGHGRVGTRRCWAIDIAGKGLFDESRRPDLQSVALAETERFVAEPREAKPEAGPAEDETEPEGRYLSGLDGTTTTGSTSSGVCKIQSPCLV